LQLTQRKETDMHPENYKQLLLEQVQDELDDVEICMQRLDRDYDSGKLDTEEYEEELATLEVEMDQLNDKMESYAARDAAELYREWKDELLERQKED
jgi:hypothetical protein